MGVNPTLSPQSRRSGSSSPRRSPPCRLFPCSYPRMRQRYFRQRPPSVKGHARRVERVCLVGETTTHRSFSVSWASTDRAVHPIQYWLQFACLLTAHRFQSDAVNLLFCGLAGRIHRRRNQRPRAHARARRACADVGQGGRAVGGKTHVVGSSPGKLWLHPLTPTTCDTKPLSPRSCCSIAAKGRAGVSRCAGAPLRPLF